MLVDTMPEKLLANTEDSVWSVIIDQTPAMQLQATYHVSTTVNQVGSVTLRLISATRPHEADVVVDPSLVEGYLLATGQHAVLF